MRNFLALSLVSALLLVSCSHHGGRRQPAYDPYSDIELEMTKKEVKDLLGPPNDRTLSDGEEQWHYARNSGEQKKYKIIVFKKNKVIAIKNDEVAEQREFELERARAGATRINVTGGGGGSGVGGGAAGAGAVAGAPHTLVCVDHNIFGSWAEGGGCNTFGCWPAGGSCNTFGCSSRGDCSAVSCPNKVESFHCEERR